MDRKVNDIKLPHITVKNRESSKILSNSGPDNSFNVKIRPSSLNKVDDLQKKLFSKLDAYEGISKKNIGKRQSKKKKGSQLENVNVGDNDATGYQKLQKLMPGLYSKLVEVKRGSMIELASPGSQTPSFKTQPKITNRQIATAEEQRNKQFKVEKTKIFVTGQEEKAERVDRLMEQMMSAQQMEDLYLQYSKGQNLPAQTSAKQLQNLGDNINYCQKQIENLTKSMESLIREIGMECIAAYQDEDEKK